jgi:hypothetical protein
MAPPVAGAESLQAPIAPMNPSARSAHRPDRSRFRRVEGGRPPEIMMTAL